MPLTIHQSTKRDPPGSGVTNDGTAAYTFDAENHLTSADNASRGLACHIYNAEGQRVRKTSKDRRQ